MKYLCLMRVKHYLKNMLVLLPLIFSGMLLDRILFIKGIVIFISFSLTSSIVYIINDLMDIKKDRLHPIKKKRELASGEVKVGEAIGLIVIIFLVLIALLYFSNLLFMFGNVILITYLVMNVLYSIELKEIPLLDITILSFGFVFRVIYGGLMLNIEISNWLFLTVLSISYYMALGKRRNEYDSTGSKTREVLKYYTKKFLDKAMYMFLGLSIVFYSLWSIFGVNNILFKYSVVFVIIILLKYSLDVEKDLFGDPIDIITHDRTLIFITMLYGLFCLFTLYGGILW